MGTPTKLLTATLLTMWITTKKQCSPVARIIPPLVDLYHLTELSNKIEKYKEDREALYEEEHNLLQKEPETDF